MISYLNTSTKLAFDTTINTFNDEQYGRFTYYANNATDLNLLDQQISSIAAEVPDLDNKIMLAIADEVERLKACLTSIAVDDVLAAAQELLGA